MSAPETAAAAAPTPSRPKRKQPALLDQVIKVTRPQNEQEAERTKSYFRRFLDQVVKPGQVISKDVEANIKHWIGEIDKSLSTQLNEVMHHPDFQKLEGTWRGLHYLVHQSRNRRKPENPRFKRHEKRIVQRSGKSRRIRSERAVQKNL